MTRRLACLFLLSALALVFETAPAAALGAASPPGISYQGGPVLHANRTYLIFWSPSNHRKLSFDPGYMALMQRFLGDVARGSRSTASTYGITGQYRDSRGPAAYASTYGGHVLDTHPAPASGCSEPPAPTGPGWPVCLTDSQLQHELSRVIAAHHLPTQPDDIYFLVTPDGFGDCQAAGPSDCALGGFDGGYCGYHSVAATGFLYAVIPYNAISGHCRSSDPRPNGSTADPALSTISHEQAETITDPYGNAWVDSDGSEIADLCVNTYGPTLGGRGSARWNEQIGGHHYWLQKLYSRLTGGCAARPRPDTAAIRTPQRIVARRPARLIAHANQPGGKMVAFNWNFGDRHGGRGPRPVHTYARPGVYRVYLRVTDSAGNWAYAKRTVYVRRA